MTKNDYIPPMQKTLVSLFDKFPLICLLLVLNTASQYPFMSNSCSSLSLLLLTILFKEEYLKMCVTHPYTDLASFLLELLCLKKNWRKNAGFQKKSQFKGMVCPKMIILL